MKDEKICKTCRKPFTWRKKWKKTGQMYFTVVKGAEEVKIKKSFAKLI